MDSRLKILGMTEGVDARLNFRHDKKSGTLQRIKTRLPRQAKNSKANSQREARKPQEGYNLRRDLQSFGGFKREQKKPSVPTNLSLFFLAFSEKLQDGLPLKSFELLIFQTEALFSILRLNSSEPMANIIYHYFSISSIGS